MEGKRAPKTPRDTTVAPAAWERLWPVLAHVQTHLGDELTLDTLAESAGLSTFHFQRVFRAAMRETPRQYVERLRLERAAFELKISDASIARIAANIGFQSHEVFTRAFVRRFASTPRRYREDFDPSPQRPAVRPAANATTGYTISKTTVHHLRDVHVVFIRQTGPYVDVDPGVFSEVLEWTRNRGLLGSRPVAMGVGHDDPTITEPAQLRFDACVQIPYAVEADGRVGCQTLPGGPHAITTYVGPFGEPLVHAYPVILQQAARLRGYELVALPAIEIYSSTDLGDEYALHHTDVVLPLRRRY